MPTELFPFLDVDVKERVRQFTPELKVYLDELADSIKHYGLLQPILINQVNTLTDGWCRFTAWHKLYKEDPIKYANIPVHRREQLSDAEYFELELESNVRRRQFTWRENIKAVCKVHTTRKRDAVLKQGTASAWTLEMTGELLGGYSAAYVHNCLKLESVINTDAYKDCTGITDAVRLYEKGIEDAGVAEMAKRTALRSGMSPQITNSGVVSQQVPDDLSNLMAGDQGELIVNLSQSLFLGDSIRDVLPKWPNDCVDHIVCDPPFAIDVDQLQQSSHALMDVSRVRDTHQVEENLELHALMFPLFYRLLKDCGFLVVWLDIMQWQRSYDLATVAGFRVQRWPHVWCKTSQCKNQMAYQNETKATEFVMLCRKGNAVLPTPVNKNFTLAAGLDEKMSNPFAKPFEVWEPLISAVSIEGQVILDPFAGEGTCPRAALRLRRPVIAIEKDVNHFNYMLESIKAHWKSVHPNVKFV